MQTWTGWDDTLWRISGDPSSPVRLKAGVRGLDDPPWKRYSANSPSVAGTRYRGSVAEEREVFWPVGVYAAVDSTEWLALHRAFRRTLEPRRTGVWTVTQPDGEQRQLVLRYVGTGGHVSKTDPSRLGWERYGIDLVAEQPFWQGTPIVRSWKAEVPPQFFGGAGIITIASGSTLANAAIGNPGDEPSWPVWTITGPCTSVQVGVAGRVVVVPFTLAAGEVLVIDTDPSQQTAIMSTGVERTHELGAADFASVPPGESVALSLSMVGSGTVSASLTPLYHRAW